MSNFLYPMLDSEPPAQRAPELAALLADLAGSVRAQAADSARTVATVLEAQAPALAATAAAMAAAFAGGGRLLTFGNGGSATDAAALAAQFATPEHGRPLPARSLAADPALLTALANDIGVEVLFARQLAAAARPGDIALGLSTSGGSANVLAAFTAARRRGALTVGMAGYGGGAMRTCPDLDHLLVVDGQSVHRTQEAQSALACALWQHVQDRLEHLEQA